MKLIITFVPVTILLLAFPAFGEPKILEGNWCISMYSAYSSPDPYYFYFEQYPLVIEDEQSTNFGYLFYGYVDVVDDGSDPEQSFFSGVLDGETISLTSWDGITRGKYTERRGNEPATIEFINNAFDADDRSSKTSIGIATKMKNNEVCPLEKFDF